MITTYKIFEILTSIKETEYRIVSKQGYFIKDEKDYKIFFKTNSGAEYKLDLMRLKEDDIIINNQSILDLSTSKNEKGADIFAISYTLKSINLTNYDKSTNKNEHYEVLGKVCYLLKEFMQKYPQYNIFCFGNLDQKRDTFYSNYLKLFKEFNYYKVPSNYSHNGEAFYLIKK